MINDFKSALVVVAHPDDEVLGLGGTTAKLASRCVTVDVLILATGATSRSSVAADNTGAIDRLREQANAAAFVLGTNPPKFGDFPDNAMDTVALLDVVKAVEAAVLEVQPELILTHHGSDLNIDHRITHEAVLTACRPLPGSKVKAIMTVETASSTEWQSTGLSPFKPNVFIDVSSSLNQKLDALRCYVDEMRPSPHPRSLEQISDLAGFRGRSVGVDAAEAFELVRCVG